jgi:hypothetical protein
MKKINKEKLLLFDFWFTVGSLLFDFFPIFILAKYLNIHKYIFYISMCVNIIFIIACFLKSIIGILLLIKGY